MAPTKIIGFARLRQGLTSWDGYEKNRVEKLDEKLVVWHNLGRPTPRSLIIQLGKSRGAEFESLCKIFILLFGKSPEEASLGWDDMDDPSSPDDGWD